MNRYLLAIAAIATVSCSTATPPAPTNIDPSAVGEPFRDGGAKGPIGVEIADATLAEDVAWFVNFFGVQNPFTAAEKAATALILQKLDRKVFRKIVCEMSNPHATLHEREAALTSRFTPAVLDAADPTATDHIFLLGRATEILAGLTNTQFIEDKLVDIDIDATPGDDPIDARHFVSERIDAHARMKADRLVGTIRDYRSAAPEIQTRGSALIDRVIAQDPQAAHAFSNRSIGLRLIPVTSLSLLVPLKRSYPTIDAPAPFSIAYLYGIDSGRGPKAGEAAIDLQTIGPVTRDQAATLVSIFTMMKGRYRFEDEALSKARYIKEFARHREMLRVEVQQLSVEKLDTIRDSFINAAVQIDRDTARFGLIDAEFWNSQCADLKK